MGARPLFAAVALLASFVAVRAGQTVPSVPLKRFPEPVESKVGDSTEWCTTVSASVRVCDVVSADHSIELKLIADGRPTVLAADRVALYQGMLQIFQADLDGDGTQELIVVDHISTSNGMAMTEDRISIVERSDGPKPTWVSFEVDEFGHGQGTFVRRIDRPGNWILATEWARSETLDPQRGFGTYLVARWLRYEKSRLVPEPGILVRRLLNSFDAERSTDSELQPYSFFLDGKGRSVERDPALGSGDILSTFVGKITQVTPDSCYEILRNDGLKTRTTFGVPYGENPEEHIDHIGLMSINRVLPAGVAPSALGMDVKGRTFRLVRYRDGKTLTQSVLWIE